MEIRGEAHMTNSIENRDELPLEPGVFAIPLTSDLDPTPESLAVRGAARTTWDEHDESTSTDFPMIVWLRGDEPWFSQFDMDAEAVMSALGIKRSRLTQISGKELRVGRVRMDRYIRPVYRSLDVEEYLKWTRATASHQKSSDAIKLAVDQLQQQSENIQTTLASVTSSFADALKSEMSLFISECVSSGIAPVVEGFGSFVNSMNESVTRLELSVQSATTSLGESTSSLSKTIETLALKQSAALEAVTLQMNQLSEKTALMEERMSAWDLMIQANLGQITQDLAELRKPKRFEKAKGRKPKRQTIENQSTTSSRVFAGRNAPTRRKPAKF
jgi:hypothetical protein